MRKILIVDDNPDILQVMQLLLGSRGFEIDVTTHADETFSRIHSFQPGLIFLDVFLGDFDGREICKEIKSNQNLKQLPVILFSANKVKSSSITDCFADAFISKPFDIIELVDKVNSLLPPIKSTESMIA